MKTKNKIQLNVIFFAFVQRWRSDIFLQFSLQNPQCVISRCSFLRALRRERWANFAVSFAVSLDQILHSLIYYSNNIQLMLLTLCTRPFNEIHPDEQNSSKIRRLLAKKRFDATSDDCPPNLKLMSLENFVHGLEASFKRYLKRPYSVTIA